MGSGVVVGASVVVVVGNSVVVVGASVVVGNSVVVANSVVVVGASVVPKFDRIHSETSHCNGITCVFVECLPDMLLHMGSSLGDFGNIPVEASTALTAAFVSLGLTTTREVSSVTRE